MRTLGCVVVVVVGVAACSSSTSAPAGEGSGVAVANAPSSAPRGHADVPAAIRDQELATSAHVVVLKGGDAFAEYRDVIASARKLDRSVVAASPFAFGELEITLGTWTHRVQVKGIDATGAARLYRLGPFVVDAHSLETFATPSDVPTILVGLGLIKQLHAYTGANVTLSGSGGAREARIVGEFHLDNEILDHLVLAPFAAVQGMVGHGDVAIGVDITLSDVDRSAEFANKLGTALGASYQVMDWYELNRASTKEPVR